MRAWEAKRQLYLAEAHAKARAGIRVHVEPAPTLQFEPVASVTCSIGTLHVARGPATKLPWRIVGPRGRVWGNRSSSDLAVAAMHRFASRWPLEARA